MKKAGIIGGIGPVSTLDYYSGIINGVRQKTNNENYPEILINSVNMTKMLKIITNKDWESLISMLLVAISPMLTAVIPEVYKPSTIENSMLFNLFKDINLFSILNIKLL